MRFGTIALVFTAFFFASCAGNKICYDCTTQFQQWDKLPWASLEGTWRGSVEVVTNNVTAKKKDRKDEVAELTIVSGARFLQSQGVKTCIGLPRESYVFLGQLWTKDTKRSYEVLAQSGSDRVSYGRISLEGTQGEKFCRFQAFGGEMRMNRLELPSVTFSERGTPNGRVLASGLTPEQEVTLEFLNFRDKEFKTQAFNGGSRKPASVESQDRPPLMLRVFRTRRQVGSPYAMGEWIESQEYLYRLWRKK